MVSKDRVLDNFLQNYYGWEWLTGTDKTGRAATAENFVWYYSYECRGQVDRQDKGAVAAQNAMELICVCLDR